MPSLIFHWRWFSSTAEHMIKTLACTRSYSNIWGPIRLNNQVKYFWFYSFESKLIFTRRNKRTCTLYTVHCTVEFSNDKYVRQFYQIHKIPLVALNKKPSTRATRTRTKTLVTMNFCASTYVGIHVYLIWVI